MSVAICGYHNKPICKECHHCEDCGKDACIHTERGRFTRDITRTMIGDKGTLSNEDVLNLQFQVELWENKQLKKQIKKLEMELSMLNQYSNLVDIEHSTGRTP